MGLRITGAAIFAVLLRMELVTTSEEEVFVDYFAGNDKALYKFNSGPLATDGWFQKGVGVCCGTNIRSKHMNLLRDTNHTLSKIKDFHRRNPSPEQQQNYLTALSLRETGAGMDVVGTDEMSATL